MCPVEASDDDDDGGTQGFLRLIRKKRRMNGAPTVDCLLNEAAYGPDFH